MIYNPSKAKDRLLHCRVGAIGDPLSAFGCSGYKRARIVCTTCIRLADNMQGWTASVVSAHGAAF